MEDSRRRYSTFAKSLIFGIQMIASVLMAVCAVILTEYINQKFFSRHQAWALFPWAKQSVWMLTVFGILWLFCLCYLTVAAGKRADDRELHLNKFDELRTELQFLLLAGTMAGILFLAMQIHRQSYQMMGRMIMAGTFALLAQLCFMGIYLSLVRKVKTETFTSNSFLGTLISNLRQNIKNPYLKTASAQKKKLLDQHGGHVHKMQLPVKQLVDDTDFFIRCIIKRKYIKIETVSAQTSSSNEVCNVRLYRRDILNQLILNSNFIFLTVHFRRIKLNGISKECTKRHIRLI